MKIHYFQICVCDACLHSEGAECHTPECMFWMHDVPTTDTADAFRGAMQLAGLRSYESIQSGESS